MSPRQAGELMRRARQLLRTGQLTHHDLAILDSMMWACRAPGSAAVSVSYSRLCQLAHVARGTVSKALSRLEALGVLTRIKRRVHVGWMSLQATSLYRFATEFTPQPVYRGQEKTKKLAWNKLRKTIETKLGLSQPKPDWLVPSTSGTGPRWGHVR